MVLRFGIKTEHSLHRQYCFRVTRIPALPVVALVNFQVVQTLTGMSGTENNAAFCRSGMDRRGQTGITGKGMALKLKVLSRP